ncbi:alpha/beta-hydrolase [Ascobolus immersus RN42]|uniref:Alpha/beta-hydrolase n=1 Tax=Ascobolus immersus RN42 TaxID=1160509 RepID=A0A3N4I9V8_ASCIM|nr:alpha/beta-hydrolase [Ascobolus immersus RN42]
MQFQSTFLSLFSAILVAQSVVATASPSPEPGIKDSIKAVFGNKGDKTVKTLDANLLPNLQYYAQFSAAAYCDPLNKVDTRTHCTANACPLVTSNPVHTLYTFANTDHADTTGFIARDDSTKNIVLTFRGSSSIRNWIQNAQFGLDEVKYCSGCKAHKGFLKGFEGVWSTIWKQLESAVKANPEYGIVTTGHSLGGAMATFAATEMRATGKKVTLYTYGAPRVGNVAFSDHITQSGENYRVAHLDDPVVRVPPTMMGYGYISPEYHIKKGNTASEVTEKDIDVIENPSGELKGLDFDQHAWYLTNTPISKCKPEGGIELRDVRLRRSELKWTRSDMSVDME